MKISAKSNIYEATAESVLEVFEAFVTPPTRGGGCLAASLSSATPSETAKNAIEKSLESLGYGSGRCAFITHTIDETTLGGNELLTIVEGLDPLCLVIADDACASAVEQGYRESIARDATSRLLGRACVCFHDFEALLENAAGKQKAWALLKQLPRL